MDSGSWERSISIVGKSAHIAAESETGRKAVWDAQFEERWMFAADVDHAMKSSGITKGTTSIYKISRCNLMCVIRVNGGFGARVDDRRDASLWKQGI